MLPFFTALSLVVPPSLTRLGRRFGLCADDPSSSLGHCFTLSDDVEILALTSLAIGLHDKKTRLYKMNSSTSFCHCVVDVSRSLLPAANHGFILAHNFLFVDTKNKRET